MTPYLQVTLCVFCGLLGYLIGWKQRGEAVARAAEERHKRLAAAIRAAKERP